MNIRDLNYLVAIADYKHFGKAAESCFVSQPALSMQIKKLEKYLGVVLIERTNKSVFLTGIGKEITAKAREVLVQIETMKTIAETARDPFSGELKLGVIPTLGPYLLPFIIPILTTLFPKITFLLTEDQTQHLIDKLKRGILDAALFGLPIIDPEFAASPLFNEELLLATPLNHSLSKHKKVNPDNLKKEELLLLEDGHCLRDQALILCDAMKISVNKKYQATSLETLRHMVASRAGITLMPKLSSRENDGICYIPFSKQKPERTVGMIWRTSSPKIQLLEHLILEIRKILKTHNKVQVIQTKLFCQA